MRFVFYREQIDLGFRPVMGLLRLFHVHSSLKQTSQSSLVINKHLLFYASLLFPFIPRLLVNDLCFFCLILEVPGCMESTISLVPPVLIGTLSLTCVSWMCTSVAASLMARGKEDIGTLVPSAQSPALSPVPRRRLRCCGFIICVLYRFYFKKCGHYRYFMCDRPGLDLILCFLE